MKGELLLYLRGGRLYGLWRGKEFQAPLAALPHFPRVKATLMVEEELIWYRLLSLPYSPHLDLRRLGEHELRTSLEDVQAYVTSGREVGRRSGREGEVLYCLLTAVPRAKVREWFDVLQRQGVFLERIISPLDLFIEKGRQWAEGRSCCLLLIEGQAVLILLFADGEFVFWRGFELATSTEDPRVADELAMELRRSALYLQQEYKVWAEMARVVAPPTWLDASRAEEVGGKSGLRVELQPLPNRASPWLAMMEASQDLIPGLPSLLPADLKVAGLLRRRRAAVALGSLLLSLLMILWAGLKVLEYRNLRPLAAQSERVLRMWEPLLKKKRERLAELEELKASTKGLFRFLAGRSHVRWPLEALGYLLPPAVYLEDLQWYGPQGERRLRLEAKVEVEDLQRRQELFERCVEVLKVAPFVQRLQSDPSGLLGEGRFTLELTLKEIEGGGLAGGPSGP
ncbi:TPA: hypothetical protein EYP84_03235 [Candidatus Bipolaricaulota bacterium]|nr:hypothetical protein [Candidatus Bipolaricaulota bacterium]